MHRQQANIEGVVVIDSTVLATALLNSVQNNSTYYCLSISAIYAPSILNIAKLMKPQILVLPSLQDPINLAAKAL